MPKRSAYFQREKITPTERRLRLREAVKEMLKEKKQENGTYGTHQALAELRSRLSLAHITDAKLQELLRDPETSIARLVGVDARHHLRAAAGGVLNGAWAHSEHDGR